MSVVMSGYGSGQGKGKTLAEFMASYEGERYDEIIRHLLDRTAKLEKEVVELRSIVLDNILVGGMAKKEELPKPEEPKSTCIF